MNILQEDLLNDPYNFVLDTFAKAYDISNNNRYPTLFRNFIQELENLCINNSIDFENFIIYTTYIYKSSNGIQVNYNIIYFIIQLIIDIPLNYYNFFNKNCIIYNSRLDIPQNLINFDTIQINYINSNDINQVKYNNFDFTSSLIHILFTLLIKVNNNILSSNISNIPENYFITPFIYLVSNEITYFKRGHSKEQLLKLNSLKLLLRFGKHIVIIQQSYIRRFLAKIKVIRLKKYKVLEEILYAGPKQIEFNFFEYFLGGFKYNEVCKKYHKNHLRNI